MPRRPPRRFPWVSLPDEELLQLRLKDLKVALEGTWLESCLEDLHHELAEWLGSGRMPGSRTMATRRIRGIAIPFYLAHPRLMQLERKMIIDVEGSTVPECIRILRREAGTRCRSVAAPAPVAGVVGRSSTPTTIGRTRPAGAMSSICRWYAQSHRTRICRDVRGRARSNWQALRRLAGAESSNMSTS